MIRRVHERLGTVGLLGACLLAGFVAVGIAGALHGDPEALVAPGLEAPSLSHPFGTDTLGRDLLARTGTATRTSLFVALSSVAIAAAVAIPLGAFTAWHRGRWIDSALQRIVETVQVVPPFVLMLVLLGVGGTRDREVLGITVTVTARLIMALALGFIPYLTRVMRATAVAELQEDYVEGLRLLGVRSREILWREVIPNQLPALAVQLLLAVAIAIFAEGGLSFLGLGIPAPAPTLGNLIAESGGQLLDDAWWYALLPGLVLVTGITGINLLGDAATDRMLGPSAPGSQSKEQS